MDALRKLGSMRSRRRVSAAASAQAPEKLAEVAGTAAPLNNKEDVGDQVSNGVSDFVQDEASNGEVFLHEEEEEEEEETEGEENSTARLTPIRAPVSVDDDGGGGGGGGGGGDGDVSSGSGESFDSALERMAASSTPSYEASPVGSYNAPSSHILHNMMMMQQQEQEEEQQKGLGVGQQGALMRLNHMISGQSTLDTAVIENCTEEEFKHKMEEIARSKDLSLDDARISSIMDALLPLLLVHDQGGGSQTASESKPEYDERNVVLEEEDDKNKNEDVDDASASAAMPVAKLSAEDEEEEELLIEGDQAFEEKGERPNGDEFVEANEGTDEGEEDEETLFDNRKGNIIRGNLSRISAHESRDDDKTEEVATAQAATSEEKQSDFPSDAVLPKELGSVLITHEEPILQKGATRETKEEEDGDIENKTELLLVPQEESEECKETESNAEALAEKESATGGPSEEETLPLVVSETRFAQPKGEEDVPAAPKESSHIEAVEVGKEAPKPSPVVEDKSESEIGEDNSTITVPINTEQAITMKEEEEEGVPEEVASEEADGLRAVENRAASESAIISKPPRGEVNTEEEESLLSAVPKQVSSRDVIEDCESVETNSIVDSVTDKDGFDNQTTPELPIATEDFTTEEDRANKATTAVLLAAENDKTLDASDVDLSLPDTVKSVNPVTENGGPETAAVVEAEPKSAFLSELQDSNGDWDGEEEDKEEVNDEEEDGDEEEEEEEEERGNLDAAEALAALVKSARSESESRSENSKTPSLGAAGPSLPQRPTGRSRPTTALEPPRNPPHSNVATASQLAAPPEDNPSNGDGNDGNDETREKLQNIRVKFLRLAHRLGQSPQNVVVAQVLYRLGLAEQLRGGRSASRAGAFSFDRANAIAEEQEAVSGQEEELDFACTVLLLGKTGVGKSATINSIFDEPRTSTNAFHPSTKKVQEIVGHVHGIKVRVIDTPGLLPSVTDQQHNERIMGSVKNYIRKSSPDIVLYFDRLDMQSRDYGDLPLLRTITDLFGAAIWFNAIVVLTHASSAPPDGPNGVPLSYEMFVAQRSHVVQQTIRQAAGDMRLMNPVSLVENHPACRTNRAGQRVLPNGQIWKPQLLLLCFASKILADANSLLKLQDTSSPGRPFGQRPRVPPLPFLLSSLLQSRAQLKVADEQMGDEDDADSDDESDVSDGDDYDELPPFRPLAKEELEELSKEQKQQYAEEVADRERLFQKKQWREELKQRKEMKQRAAAMSKEELAHAEEGVDDDGGRAAAVPVPMPDMALPPSFDSDSPTHRYRYLETANQWLVRPVLETHGWDHDAGYDGFNVEKLFVVADKIPASISGQVTKDKKESQVNFEAAASFKHGECKSTLAGFDIQTIGKDLGYTLRSETQFNNFKRNKTTAGLTFTLLGDTIAAGLKLEDRLLIGKRFKVVVNGGVLTGRGDKAFGGSLEATLRGKQYPLSRTLSTLGLSVMDWHGDLAIGGNLQSQFMVGKTMMVARANLNNRGAGQVSIRASSSEQLQMVLIGIVPIFRSLINSWFGTAQPSQ